MFIIINLHVYISGLFLYCYYVEGKLFPSVLKSKLRNMNETDFYEKIWMKYIENRLEILYIHLEKQKHIHSFLDIIKRNSEKQLFKKLPANCQQLGFNNPAGIQMSIYGKICGSSNSSQVEKVEQNIPTHLCSHYAKPERQALCYLHLQMIYGKYTGCV